MKPRLLLRYNGDAASRHRYRHLFALLQQHWDLTLFGAPRSSLRDLWGKAISFWPNLNE